MATLANPEDTSEESDPEIPKSRKSFLWSKSVVGALAELWNDEQSVQRYLQVGALREYVESGDVKLLKASTLARLAIEKKLRGLNRQGVEAEHPEVFADQATVKRCLVEVETAALAWEVSYPGVLVISYCWLSADHPDPDGNMLLRLAEFLHWYAAMRVRYTKKRLYDPDEHEWNHAYCIRDREEFDWEFVVFIDFWSLLQAPRSDEQQAKFERALNGMNTWYGHRGTAVLCLTEVPDSWLDSESFKARGGYCERGWTTFEQLVSALSKVAGNCMDFAGWENVFKPEAYEAYPAFVRERVLEDRRVEKRKALTGLFEGASEAQLAGLAFHDGDYSSSGDWSCCRPMVFGRQIPPMEPASMERLLRSKRFSDPRDLDACSRGYAEVARAVMGSQTELRYMRMPHWGVQQWSMLGGVMGLCRRLRVCYIERCDMVDEQLTAFVQAVPQGAPPLLRKLVLTRSDVGEEGLRALATALRMGVMPELREVLVEERLVEAVEGSSEGLVRRLGAAAELEVTWTVEDSVGCLRFERAGVGEEELD